MPSRGGRIIHDSDLLIGASRTISASTTSSVEPFVAASDLVHKVLLEEQNMGEISNKKAQNIALNDLNNG